MSLITRLRTLATRPLARSEVKAARPARDLRADVAGGMTPAAPIQRWWVTYVLVSAVTIIALLAALDAVARILQPLAHISLVVLFALGLAFILAPIAQRLERVLGRPAPAVLVTFLLALAILGGAVALVSAPLITESKFLAEQMPAYAARLQSGEMGTILGFQVPIELRTRAATAVGDLGGTFASEAVIIVLAVVSSVVDIFLVLVIALYLLLDQQRIRTFGLRLLPARALPHAERVEGEMVRVFGAYVRGQLLLGLVVGVTVAVALSLLGVPYALFLGVFAGVAELVPFLGPIIGAVPAVLVAAFQPFPLVLWVVLAFVVIQQIESNLLFPRISGEAIGVHPLAAMLALLVGLQVGGVVGGLFAVPLAGIAWVFISAGLDARTADAGVNAAPSPASAATSPAVVAPPGSMTATASVDSAMPSVRTAELTFDEGAVVVLTPTTQAPTP